MRRRFRPGRIVVCIVGALVLLAFLVSRGQRDKRAGGHAVVCPSVDEALAARLELGRPRQPRGRRTLAAAMTVARHFGGSPRRGWGPRKRWGPRARQPQKELLALGAARARGEAQLTRLRLHSTEPIRDRDLSARDLMSHRRGGELARHFVGQGTHGGMHRLAVRPSHRLGKIRLE